MGKTETLDHKRKSLAWGGSKRDRAVTRLLLRTSLPAGQYPTRES